MCMQKGILKSDFSIGIFCPCGRCTSLNNRVRVRNVVMIVIFKSIIFNTVIIALSLPCINIIGAL
jgi:hypothetical protein